MPLQMDLAEEAERMPREVRTAVQVPLVYLLRKGRPEPQCPQMASWAGINHRQPERRPRKARHHRQAGLHSSQRRSDQAASPEVEPPSVDPGAKPAFGRALGTPGKSQTPAPPPDRCAEHSPEELAAA